MASFNHRVFRLPDKTIDYNDRFGGTCRATRKCEVLATHLTEYDYVTGRSGRVSDSGKQVCQPHAEKFATKHGVTIEPPRASAPSVMDAAVATMTPGPPKQVRVHRTRSSHWYLERRGGLLAVWSRWLSGTSPDADLDVALVEAERDLANDYTVPAGPWQRDGLEAKVEVIPVWRHDDWFFTSWTLTVACDEEGMWRLTRVLDGRFKAITDRLGRHNMSLDRALKVADELLADEQWVMFGGQWSTFDDNTAEQGAWHPDQAHPERWRA
jgi:hypothetical protein